MTFILIFLALFIAELVYFKIADHFNIIDKPNERSSHTRVVLRGGGIIFLCGLWLWSALYGLQYPWLLAAVTLAAGVSFVDDIHSLPDSVRLTIQFIAMLMLFIEIGMMQWELWWAIPIALIVCVGATNIYNFMDGINGITGGYSLAVLIPLLILNHEHHFIEESLLIVIGLALLVFCFFNFRKRAKCFAGDVGSIGIAFLLLFAIGKLVMQTGDVTWLILLLIYGVDGCLTIIHRIMLHENLGEAHRKHAYQLMANELKIPHTVVSSVYLMIQLLVSLIAIYVIPDTILMHWIYFISAILFMSLVYVSFMRKFYHLHEEYLKSLKNE